MPFVSAGRIPHIRGLYRAGRGPQMRRSGSNNTGNGLYCYFLTVSPTVRFRSNRNQSCCRRSRVGLRGNGLLLFG